MMVTGIITLVTSPYVTPDSVFQDTYPVNDEWGLNGTHDNTISDAEGSLIIDDTNENGVYESDTIDSEQLIEFERIVYEANNIRNNQDQIIDITIQGLKDGAIEDSRVIEVREDGRHSVNTGNLTRSDYDSYKFIVDLETGSSTSPELSELSITGRTYLEEDYISLSVFLILFFLGMLKMIKALGN